MTAIATPHHRVSVATAQMRAVVDGVRDASVWSMTETETGQTLIALARAKAKLAEGTYGRCDVCGEPIDEDRLEFRPWSTRCVDHA